MLYVHVCVVVDQVWDLAQGACVQTVARAHNNAITSIMMWGEVSWVLSRGPPTRCGHACFGFTNATGFSDRVQQSATTVSILGPWLHVMP